MTKIKEIQDWYKLHCNGDWEHEYGIKIETLDNPGWNVTIDLSDTILDGLTYEKNIENSEDDWIFLKSDGNVFSGAGDFNKLDEIIDKFINSFVLPNIQKSTYELTIYAEGRIDSNDLIKFYRPIQAKVISLTQFEIISIPEFRPKDIKVLNIDDYELLDFDKLNIAINCNVGDIVKCDLIRFYDYPSLTICNE